MEPTLSETNAGSAGAGQVPEMVVASAESLAKKHGGLTASDIGRLPPKPGSAPRGRPRKDGLPAGSGATAPAKKPSTRQSPLSSALPDEEQSGGYLPPPVDPGLVRRSLNSILGWGEKLSRTIFRSKVKQLTNDPKDVERVVSKIKFEDADKELVAENLPIVLEKYGVDSGYMPEIGLATGCIGMGCSFATAMTELNEMIAEKKAHEKSQTAGKN
jgi:hypothetical protein